MATTKRSKSVDTQDTSEVKFETPKKRSTADSPLAVAPASQNKSVVSARKRVFTTYYDEKVVKFPVNASDPSKRLPGVGTFSNKFNSIDSALDYLQKPNKTIDVEEDDIAKVKQHPGVWANLLFESLVTAPEGGVDKSFKRVISLMKNRDKNLDQNFIEARCLWAVHEVIKLHESGVSIVSRAAVGDLVNEMPATHRLKLMAACLRDNKNLAKDFLEGQRALKVVYYPEVANLRQESYQRSNDKRGNQWKEVMGTSGRKKKKTTLVVDDMEGEEDESDEVEPTPTRPSRKRAREEDPFESSKKAKMSVEAGPSTDKVLERHPTAVGHGIMIEPEGGMAGEKYDEGWGPQFLYASEDDFYGSPYGKAAGKLPVVGEGWRGVYPPSAPHPFD